jgi:hypothetical protein
MSTAIFLHVPKTGGGGLQRLIKLSYSSRQVLNLGSPEWEEAYRKLTESAKKEIKVIMTHSGFGIHKHLIKPFTYFTFFRDPYIVPISWYYYIKRKPRHQLYKEVSKITLKGYVGGDLYKANPHTKRMCGVSAKEINEAKNQEQYLTLAKENLRKYFSVVGMVKRYESSLDRLCDLLDMDKSKYKRTNVSSNRPGLSELDAETIELIEENHQLDLELYEWVDENWDELNTNFTYTDIGS